MLGRTFCRHWVLGEGQRDSRTETWGGWAAGTLITRLSTICLLPILPNTDPQPPEATNPASPLGPLIATPIPLPRVFS